MRILVAEDNPKLSANLCSALMQERYSVDSVADGSEVEAWVAESVYDAIILDWMLPAKDGPSICRDLRRRGCSVPIIMLTAKGTVDDRVTGLDSGADDYLIKPFELSELFSRLRALLRRPQEITSELLRFGDLTLNTASHTVKIDETVVDLTAREYAVLEYLARNRAVIVSRDQLLDHCWDHAFEPVSNVVDVYIKQIRRKLGADGNRYIKTIRGMGYQIKS